MPTILIFLDSYDASHRLNPNSQPEFHQLNHVSWNIDTGLMLDTDPRVVFQLIAQVMTGISTSFRFSGQLNG